MQGEEKNRLSSTRFASSSKVISIRADVFIDKFHSHMRPMQTIVFSNLFNFNATRNRKSMLDRKEELIIAAAVNDGKR